MNDTCSTKMAERTQDLPIEDYTFPASRSAQQLDLYNFESAYAEDSPYVLTSPRSLEACAQLDIKPVELLLKPLSDFEEECLLTGQPISYARHMYEAYETSRLEKLKFCRQIRERIVLEDDDHSDSEDDFGPDKVKARGLISTSTLSSSLKHSPREVKHIPVVELGQGDQTGDVSQHFQTTRSAVGDAKRTKTPRQKKRRPASAQRPVSAKVGKKTKTRPKSAQRSKSAHSVSFAQMSQSAQSRSLERNCSFGSHPDSQSAQSRRSVERSSSFESHPNSSMMSMTSSKSYGSRNTSKKASVELLSERDKRILELLEAKHLLQESEEKVKRLARQAWQDEKAVEEEARAEAERQRRQKLIESSQRRQRKEERRRRQRLEEEVSNLELYRQRLQYDEEKHKRLHDVQNKLKALQIHHRQLQKLGKKKHQERHLEERERDEEEFRQAVVTQQQRSLERATEIKHRKEGFEMRERQRRNAVERARHEAVKESVNKQSEEDIEDMSHFLHLKHDRSERSLQSQTKYREQQLQYQRERALVKQVRNHQSKQELENELSEWKEHLQVKGQRSLERAVKQASNTSLQKARKASDVRRSRENLHKELLNRVKEDEEAEKAYIKEKIAYKNYKTKVHEDEKTKTIQKSREIAKVSAEFRDNIRKQYSGTFDKLVKRAELESRVGCGPQSSYKNVSTPGLF